MNIIGDVLKINNDKSNNDNKIIMIMKNIIIMINNNDNCYHYRSSECRRYYLRKYKVCLLEGFIILNSNCNHF